MAGGLEPGGWRLLYPSEYLQSFVADNLRPDGRTGLASTRPASVTCGVVPSSSVDSSALARIGHTSALAAIRLEACRLTNSASGPDEGHVVVGVEMTPLSSPHERPGQSDEAMVLTSYLSDVLAAGRGVIDMKQLCIRKGTYVWILHLDICCIEASGAAFDAVLLAAMAALRSLDIPDTFVTEEDSLLTRSAATRARLNAGGGGGGGGGGALSAGPTRLKLLHTPLSLTCGSFRGKILADPAVDEEGLLSRISVTVDEKGNVVGCFMSGAEGIGWTKIADCIQATRGRHDELYAILCEATRPPV